MSYDTQLEFCEKSMIRALIIRLLRIWDSIKTDGMVFFLHERIWINRKAVIIEKDLCGINKSKSFLQNSNMRFDEITKDKMNDKRYQFAVKNRYLKALQYLNEGYCGHVLVKGNVVIGDVWHSATIKGGKLSVHPDIQRFGIESSKDYAYSFDQFVVPTERGNKVAAALLDGQVHSLNDKGYSKVLGYYWADNLPAVWNARVMNKFKELRTLRVYRFIFWEKKSESKPTPESLNQK